MATLAQARTAAVKAGVSPSAARMAESVKEIEALIAKRTGSANGVKKSKPVQKSKPATKAAATKSTGRKAAPAKGRNSSPAKRQSTATAKKAAPAPKASAYVAKGGRNLLEDVDYTITDGWNARSGSAPDTIVKALRKFKGNREKVFDFLSDDIDTFVKRTKRDGTKWAKGERENMLRYRIARTAWDFALKTEQHEVATNRTTYGEGGTGQGIWKPAKKKAAPAKATKATKAAPAKRKPAAKAKAAPARKPAAKATPARKRATRRAK